MLYKGGHMSNQMILPKSYPLLKTTTLDYHDEQQNSSFESDPLAVYLQQISQYPLLAGEDEREIGRKIASLRRKVSGLKRIHATNRAQARENQKERVKFEKKLAQIGR